MFGLWSSFFHWVKDNLLTAFEQQQVPNLFVPTLNTVLLNKYSTIYLITCNKIQCLNQQSNYDWLHFFDIMNGKEKGETKWGRRVLQGCLTSCYFKIAQCVYWHKSRKHIWNSVVFITYFHGVVHLDREIFPRNFISCCLVQ